MNFKNSYKTGCIAKSFLSWTSLIACFAGMLGSAYAIITACRNDEWMLLFGGVVFTGAFTTGIVVAMLTVVETTHKLLDCLEDKQ